MGGLVLQHAQWRMLAFKLHFNKNRNMETKSAVTALAALAQESRLAIFRLLVQAGPEGLAAGKIGEALGIPPSSLSFHMKELAYANLVSSRQESRYVIYSANFEAMTELLAFLTENCCGGKACGPNSMPDCANPGEAPS
jgi:ArsR family transcriptional regulator